MRFIWLMPALLVCACDAQPRGADPGTAPDGSADLLSIEGDVKHRLFEKQIELSSTSEASNERLHKLAKGMGLDGFGMPPKRLAPSDEAIERQGLEYRISELEARQRAIEADRLAESLTKSPYSKP